MGEDSGSDAPWGIVSVKAQDVGGCRCSPVDDAERELARTRRRSGVALDAYATRDAYWADARADPATVAAAALSRSVPTPATDSACASGL